MRIIIGSPDPSFSPIKLEVKKGHFEKEYYDINDENLHEKLYYYTSFVTQKRWPKAEPIIMKHPGWAYIYARDRIKGRWKKAEPIIMQDPEYAYYYALKVIGGRWPEAEPHIMKDAQHAYYYAYHIIRGKWPEAEQHIKKNKFYLNLYKNLINANYNWLP